jgi:hypothetical protein
LLAQVQRHAQTGAHHLEPSSRPMPRRRIAIPASRWLTCTIIKVRTADCISQILWLKN